MNKSNFQDTRLPTDDMALKLQRLKQLSPDDLRSEWDGIIVPSHH